MAGLQSDTSLPAEIVAYYEKGQEAGRLLSGVGRLEFARTQELVLRYLPEPPAVVYDVGGGPGLYAVWLAGLGYEVHLVDITPLHVQQAEAASGLQPNHPVASLTVGEARRLDRAESSVDAALLLGPLYHLGERADRLAALREARRIVRPGGALLAAAISRFASTLEGLREGSLDDPDFVEIARQDVLTGQHRNPHDDRDYFTTAFFHHPLELKSEVEEAGWGDCRLLAIEGPGWLFQDFDERWQDPKRRETLMRAVRDLEAEPSVMGVSAHVMAVGRK